MPFYDVEAYAASIRRQRTSASGLVSGLVFSSQHDLLCALVSCGRLTMSSATPRGGISHTVALPGYARGLCATDDNLYAAGDFGLVCTAWVGEKGFIFMSDTSVKAVTTGKEGVLAAVKGGWLALIEERGGTICPVLAFGGKSEVRCLAALPNGGFLAGSDDGFVRQYDVRNTSKPMREVRIGLDPITALALDRQGTFAVTGDFSFNISSIHLPTSSIAASCTLPFRPRAVAFTHGAFYVGGSDRVDDPTRCLLRLNLSCEVQGTTPVSAKSIYSLSVHPRSGALAAAGYTAERKDGNGELTDVYINPPVRSFSIFV